jgi:phage shock protein PspC (stress-responsive transcriptional regulator)
MSSQPNNLRINHAERKFLGVCAGIADYLDMPVVLVRIIFIISILTWPTLILAYFALYFWLDRNLSTEKVTDWLSGSTPTRHLKNLDYRRPLYRNRRNRIVAGVCSGIADYLEVRPVLVRGAAVLAAFVLGPYALLGYAVCWFVMEPNPAPRYGRQGHRSHRSKKRYSRRNSRKGFSSSRINIPDDDELDDMADEAYAEAMADCGPAYDERDLDGPEDGHKGSEERSRFGLYSDSATAKREHYRKARKARQSSSRHSYNERSMEECADTYYALENRLRELEAFITSKKFRLHCEISRI